MNHIEQTNIWKRELIESRALSRTMGIGLFVVLTALGAFVRIPLPFTPIPITGQTLFVVLSGLFLKKYDGAISQGIYISIGMIGLPIFAGASGGYSAILGPTGGYLIAFLIAPYLVRLVFERTGSKNIIYRAGIALVSGIAIIHLLGIINLAAYLNIDPLQAFMLGSLPFLPGAVIKIVLGANIFSIYKKKLG